MPNTEQSILETGGVPEIEMEVEVFGMTQVPVDRTLSVPDMAADAKATGDAINTVADNLADLAADVGSIEDWTGENIPLNSQPGAPTIAEAITEFLADVYPVGSIYMSNTMFVPGVIAAIGTWTEVMMPLTWNDIKNGTRGFVARAEGETTGSVHFWLRTA